MNLSHPLSITLCQIVVDCYNMHPLTGQCIQISRKCRDQCLTFTSLHLRNTSLMKNNSSDQLYSVMLHAKCTSCRLTHNCKRLRQNIIQCLCVFQTALKFLCLILKLLVGKLLHLRPQRFNLIYNGIDTL